ncbi:hypothetical protein EVAR_87620_1 [Eumeta japonica]|uniref:Uncharacterized protein n=1 Tax=Eumeta variegata TaxID=151549 RepID=A0A4C1WJ54_EUMVA|nr:hypothetical protein EVAR_87620_1 [Eumeta japonica]
MTNASKPVPMKLFAAWEVDRTPSNCIPRKNSHAVIGLKDKLLVKKKMSPPPTPGYKLKNIPTATHPLGMTNILNAPTLMSRRFDK